MASRYSATYIPTSYLCVNLRQKNWKSGCCTRSNLTQLSAAWKRDFPNLQSVSPFGAHMAALNLYGARPKTGNVIFGTPSIPSEKLKTGARAAAALVTSANRQSM
ncbi:hypothetical protein Dimus_031116 [Dionaea muscipula]